MFRDKNGNELKIGDKIRPDEGRDLAIVSIQYVEDIGDDCMFGQQILDPMAFSLLTKENLATQWTLIEEE